MYLNSGQMQQRYGVARETLRRWEKIGRIPPRKNPSGLPKGRRFWIKSEVEGTVRNFVWSGRFN
jgi:DNA-binding transcriptional MerR regulator